MLACSNWFPHPPLHCVRLAIGYAKWNPLSCFCRSKLASCMTVTACSVVEGGRTATVIINRADHDLFKHVPSARSCTVESTANKYWIARNAVTARLAFSAVSCGSSCAPILLKMGILFITSFYIIFLLRPAAINQDRNMHTFWASGKTYTFSLKWSFTFLVTNIVNWFVVTPVHSIQIIFFYAIEFDLLGFACFHQYKNGLDPFSNVCLDLRA